MDPIMEQLYSLPAIVGSYVRSSVHSQKFLYKNTIVSVGNLP